MDNIIQILKYKPLLKSLAANPDKGYSIHSLSNISGVSYATAWRIIRSLEVAGALKIRKVGAVCLVFPDRKSEVWKNLIKAADIGTDTFIASLKNDFEFISRDVSGVLLYGSHAKGSADMRSDIDICIVKPRNPGIVEKIYAKLGDKYDVKIFEDLPAYIKLEVIENYKVIFGSEPDISYYFYGFRKIGQDMKYRISANQFSSVREMVVARKRWLNARRQVSK
ncbi:MAG: nucleotidyltransferase domain-containing protein [Candidatus Methanoperedens sp.]|nr:nucleotidyltransferase domain-containing protein [Candidatus Methanoperedens sp.]